ncbi:MAG TPA: 4-(cytidine 5'-diphospho)-2-C-methyl-D-erythritol kinase [Streptosporangiaceae bacterium]
MTARAPAKVNVRLSVGPPRGDGFHDLVNVFHAVSLFDEVTARPAERLRIVVDGRSADLVPTGEDNLAARAALLLAERTGVAPAVELLIHKAIPVAGGMAGGSADAAAALLACDALWGTGLGRTDLLALAAELGSDVPFALVGGTAVGRGRGEILTPAPAEGRFHWVFALADGGLSTPAVYAECDRLRAEGRTTPDAATPDDDLMAALAAGDAPGLGARLANDLQEAAVALRPALAATLAAGAGALGALVSGSGPTCAFLAGSAAHAAEVEAALRASATCAGTVRTDGPAPGARLV